MTGKKGNILNVELNRHLVIENARLPGIPEKGATALQYQGHKVNGE